MTNQSRFDQSKSSAMTALQIAYATSFLNSVQGDIETENGGDMGTENEFESRWGELPRELILKIAQEKIS